MYLFLFQICFTMQTWMNVYILSRELSISNFDFSLRYLLLNDSMYSDEGKWILICQDQCHRRTKKIKGKPWM